MRGGILLSLALAVGCSSQPQRSPSEAGPSDRDAQAMDAGSLDGAPRAGTGGAGGRDSGGIVQPNCRDAGCFVPIDPTVQLDLLFVVDNSGSMKEEQAALRREFPRMIQKLVSGDHDGDGTADHAKVENLHLGVVSSNVGAAPGISGCEDGGDEGALQHRGNIANDPMLICKPSYPTFLQYANGAPALTELSSDFACLSALGTAGCGFEQHLESALKAIWPAGDARLSFATWFGAAASGGRSDNLNAGFVRTGTANAGSTLGIVVVADEDDCSASDPAIFDNHTVVAGNPYGDQALNLRCFLNHDRQLPLERYVFGFRNAGAARVVFAGIVGVPVDLASAATRAKVDFANPISRDAYYDMLLADTRMQEGPDPSAPEASPQLKPACTSTLGRAEPARRFIQLAKSFGEDALIQSICGDSFGPPLDTVVERIVKGPD